MATVATLNIKIGANWSEAKKAFDEVQAAVKPVASSLTAVGTSLTKYVSVPLAAAGVASVKFAGDFQQAMRNAVSVTGLTGQAAVDAEKKMTALAMQLGQETAFTAKQAADAMYDLASSGWDANEMAAGLPGILNLAAATQSDLAATTESVTATLGQFGLGAEESGRVADVFSAAIGASKANMDRLTPSLRQVGPVASSMGMSLEDTVAVLGALYDAGFQGEQAGTALRAGLSALLEPAGAGKVALKELQLSAEQVNPELHGLVPVLELLRSKGISTSQAIALFGREAAAGMLALIGNTEGIRELTATLDNAGGTAERIAKSQLDTLNGQVKILVGSLETAAIAFGTVFLPRLQEVAESITPLINKFASLPAPMLETIGTIGLVVAAIGPLLLAVGGILTALPFMAAGWAMVSVPMLAIIGTIGAVAAAGVLLMANWDEIIGYLNDKFPGLLSWFADTWSNIADAVSTAFDAVVTIVGNGFGNLEDMLNTFSALWRGDWDELWTNIVDSSKNAVRRIGENLGAIIPHFKRIVQFIMNPGAGFVGLGIDALFGKTEEAIEKAVGKGGFTPAFQGGATIGEPFLAAGAIMDSLTAKAKEATEAVKDLGNNLGKAPPTAPDHPGIPIAGMRDDLPWERGLSTFGNIQPLDIAPALPGPGDLRGFSQATRAEMAILKEQFDKDFEALFVIADAWAQNVDHLMQGLIASMATGFETFFATGSISEGFKSFGAGILSVLGDFLIKMGTAAIMASKVGIAIRAALTNPGIGLAAGAAAIALGAALKAASKSMTEVSKGGGVRSGPRFAGNGGLVNVNPNMASTAGSGGFGGDGSSAFAVEIVPRILPSGDQIYAVQEGNRRLSRRGQKMV